MLNRWKGKRGENLTLLSPRLCASYCPVPTCFSWGTWTEQRVDVSADNHLAFITCSFSFPHLSFQPGASLPSRGHFEMSGDICHNPGRALLASHGQSSRMLLQILQCARQPLTTKMYPASNINSAAVEKLCVSDFVCDCVCVAVCFERDKCSLWLQGGCWCHFGGELGSCFTNLPDHQNYTSSLFKKDIFPDPTLVYWIGTSRRGPRNLYCYLAPKVEPVLVNNG